MVRLKADTTYDPADTLSMTTFVRTGLAAVMVAVSSPVCAQIYEVVGTRAQGMGGAFVAVADDATTTWWNPAGLASGPSASILYDRVRTLDPAEPQATGPAWLGQTSAFAFTYPALGLSYYRLRISEIRPIPPSVSSNVEPTPDRQDPGAAGVELRSISLSEYGATVAQSAGEHLVIGSTLKLVRGGRIQPSDTDPGSAEDRLERVADLDVPAETHTDLDVGLMAMFGHARAGVTVKHMRQPEFGEGDEAFTLKRQARAGVAFVTTSSGAISGLTAAFDTDLTTAETALGDVRHIAGGAELWLFQRLIGVRGGFGGNTVGEAGRSASVGLSLGARGGSYVDGALTLGSDRSRKGWALSLRLSF
jgi:hypothetical protein